VWGLFAAIVLVALARSMLRPETPALPVLHEVPDFALVNERGEPFGSADLKGSVYLANFVFTRCPSMCPALMHSMAQLQERYRAAGVDGVRLVSFSVDPEHDTPERLLQYGESYGVDPARWHLLTGERTQMRELLLDGFRVMMGEPEKVGDLIDVAHSGKLVLVDRQGRIRGYYGTDGPGLDEAFRRSKELALGR
jgi:protein SCO1/2